jgi:predicted dehydrogenase
VVARPEELVDAVDLAIVVDRHGDLHAEHALPFIERGLPVFVDKPLAIALEDCRRMIDAARESGSLLSSFSALRFAPGVEELATLLPELGAIRTAHFAGPCDFESPHGGPFFYATHVVEMALRLTGEDIETVRAIRNGGQVVVVVTWRSGAMGSLSLMTNAAYHFHATLFGETGMAVRDAFGGKPGYRNVLEEIVKMVETNHPPLDEAQLMRPIQIVHAIVASLEANGAEIRLDA